MVHAAHIAPTRLEGGKEKTDLGLWATLVGVAFLINTYILQFQVPKMCRNVVQIVTTALTT